jgi:hypothetical protein
MRIPPFLLAGALLVPALACRDDGITPMEPSGPTSKPATADALGNWIARADYPNDILNSTGVSYIDPATRRSTVYVIGGKPTFGSGAGNITSAMKAYDVTGNVWRARAPYPIRVMTTNGGVQIGGRIYVSGGFTRHWDEQRGVWRLATVASLYVYDPATGGWSRRRDMPTPHAGGRSATYGGMLYVAAGDDLLRYDPSTDRWVLLGRTPHDMWRADGGFVGGKLYLLSWQSNTMDVYDPATRTWSLGPSRPTAYGCGGASTTLEAKLYLVGCYDLNDAYRSLILDPRAGTWSEAAAPPIYASGSSLVRVVVGGRLRLELVGGPHPGNNWQYLP